MKNSKLITLITVVSFLTNSLAWSRYSSPDITTTPAGVFESSIQSLRSNGSLILDNSGQNLKVSDLMLGKVSQLTYVPANKGDGLIYVLSAHRSNKTIEVNVLDSSKKSLASEVSTEINLLDPKGSYTAVLTAISNAKSKASRAKYSSKNTKVKIQRSPAFVPGLGDMGWDLQLIASIALAIGFGVACVVAPGPICVGAFIFITNMLATINSRIENK